MLRVSPAKIASRRRIIAIKGKSAGLGGNALSPFADSDRESPEGEGTDPHLMDWFSEGSSSLPIRKLPPDRRTSSEQPLQSRKIVPASVSLFKAVVERQRPSEDNRMKLAAPEARREPG